MIPEEFSLFAIVQSNSKSLSKEAYQMIISF